MVKEIDGTRVREIDGRIEVDNDPEIEAEWEKNQAEDKALLRYLVKQTRERVLRREQDNQHVDRVLTAALSPAPPPRIEPVPPVADTVLPESQAKPLQRQRAQEAAILEAVRRHGHNPVKLPRNKPGKHGVKATVRDDVQANRADLFTGVKIFDKAWERLSASGEIVILN